jgi:hypothetical protein
VRRLHHQPDGKLFHWQYCVRCGLIYVNNPVTKQAIREGCDPKSVERRQHFNDKKSASRGG